MIVGKASEHQHLEAIMRVHRVDEGRARFILAVQRRDIAGDTAPDASIAHRRRAGIGWTIDQRPPDGPAGGPGGPNDGNTGHTPNGQAWEKVVSLVRAARALVMREAA